MKKMLLIILGGVILSLVGCEGNKESSPSSESVLPISIDTSVGSQLEELSTSNETDTIFSPEEKIAPITPIPSTIYEYTVAPVSTEGTYIEPIFEFNGTPYEWDLINALCFFVLNDNEKIMVVTAYNQDGKELIELTEYVNLCEDDGDYVHETLYALQEIDMKLYQKHMSFIIHTCSAIRIRFF